MVKPKKLRAQYVLIESCTLNMKKERGKSPASNPSCGILWNIHIAIKQVPIQIIDSIMEHTLAICRVTVAVPRSQGKDLKMSEPKISVSETSGPTQYLRVECPDCKALQSRLKDAEMALRDVFYKSEPNDKTRAYFVKYLDAKE